MTGYDQDVSLGLLLVQEHIRRFSLNGTSLSKLPNFLGSRVARVGPGMFALE